MGLPVTSVLLSIELSDQYNIGKISLQDLDSSCFLETLQSKVLQIHVLVYICVYMCAYIYISGVCKTDVYFFF